MACVLVLVLVLVCAVSARSDPFLFFHRFSPASVEGTWLWGWVWGAESAVSIVDRTPPLTFRSRPAAFGPQLDDPLLGYVLPLDSFTSPCSPRDPTNASNAACPPLCHVGPHRPDPSEPWVALVQRGECTFVDKARPPFIRDVAPDVDLGQRGPTSRRTSRRRRRTGPRSHRPPRYPR